jgi:hypothetical protein
LTVKTYNSILKQINSRGKSNEWKRINDVSCKRSRR